MNSTSTFRAFHKWFSIIIGIQLIIWAVSGFYMTVVNIDMVRGNHLQRPLNAAYLADVQKTPVKAPAIFAEISGITLKPWLDLVIMEVTDSKGKRIYDSQTGQEIHITEEHIRLLTVSRYSGSSSIIDIQLLEQYPSEIGGRQQRVWRVNFDDWINTSFYFNPQNGDLIRVRSDLWRAFDFLWGLHIMDYDTRENTNNSLLFWASLISLVSVISGILLMTRTLKIKSGHGFRGIIYTAHKWLGLIVALQLLLWLTSGLAFNLIHHDDRNSNQLLKKFQQQFVTADVTWFNELIKEYPSASTITLFANEYGPVAKVHIRNQEAPFYVRKNAKNNSSPQLTKSQIANAVLKQLKEPVDIISNEFIETKTAETRKLPVPVWKVTLDNEEETRLFLHPLTGKVLRTMNNTEFWHDFFLMLHFMDYGDRGNLNNPIVITFGTLTLFLTLSGAIMIFWTIDHTSRLHRTRKTENEVPVKLCSENGHRKVVNIKGNVSLFEGLLQQDVELPSTCGGGGACGQCKVRFIESPPKPTAADKSQLTVYEIQQGYRLACMTALSEQQEIQVDTHVFTQQTLVCKIKNNQFQTPFIKELELELPAGESFEFEAGEHIIIHCPPHVTPLNAIEMPDSIRQRWQQRDLLTETSTLERTATRLYSMANAPHEEGKLVLNVRLAEPVDGHPPGQVSPYLFALKPGDFIEISGPFGDFHIVDDDKEIIFIAGGAGMAPIRSHLSELLLHLKRKNKITLWYGAREESDLYYQDWLADLATANDNFSWFNSLSENVNPAWDGHQGYIHQVLFDHYLFDHPAPENCHYFLCGPPNMIRSTRKLLIKIGVPLTNIQVDDFGHQ